MFFVVLEYEIYVKSLRCYDGLTTHRIGYNKVGTMLQREKESDVI